MNCMETYAAWREERWFCTRCRWHGINRIFRRCSQVLRQRIYIYGKYLLLHKRTALGITGYAAKKCDWKKMFCCFCNGVDIAFG